MTHAGKRMHAHRMRVHQSAIRTLIDDARDRVVEAKRAYLAVPFGDTVALLSAQCRLLEALTVYFDANERAAGRR